MRRWGQLASGLAGLVASLCLPSGAWAQESDESKPPFYDVDAGKDQEEGSFSGNITSSSFFFTESGAVAPVGVGGGLPPESASSVDRVFTELRLKLRGDKFSGGALDFRADLRFRGQLASCEPRLSEDQAGQPITLTDCLHSQSGTFGGEERDVRELFLRYRSGDFNINLGRQFAPELAAIKFDGLRVEQDKGEQWKYFGFAGLYPMRGSRDYRSDYPVYALDPADLTAGEARLLPAVVGVGGSYRKEKIYGSVGAAGILPRAKEFSTGLEEPTRILVSSNGYWQQSEKTDVYHFVVVDLGGVNGAGLSNLSLGANFRPNNAVNIFGRVNRVDTETLNVHAQLRLDAVDQNAATAARIQNNWYVARVAQESAEVGASSSFSQNRFQLTASGELRRRPEITVLPTGPEEAPVVLPLAQALDIRLQFVDRRSIKDFRIGGSVTRTLNRGDERLDRSKATIARIEAGRDLKEGKGEFEVNVEYVQSDDQSLADNCPPGQADFLQCFGTSQSSTIGAGGVVFYRPKKDWFAMGMVSAATQALTTSDAAEVQAAQPSVLMLSGFVRLAYRF